METVLRRIPDTRMNCTQVVEKTRGNSDQHPNRHQRRCLMGASLVAQVLTGWTHLADRPFRLLVRMALTALDRPAGGRPAATYFAGRELLAMTLRSDGGSEQSRNRAVARAVAELIEEGAIERADAGRPGHNAVYRLTLTAGATGRKGGRRSHPESDSEGDAMGGRRDHLVGGSRDHPMGDSGATKQVASETTPRTHEEPIEELYEEAGVEETTTSHRSRAKPPNDERAPVIQLFQKSAEPAVPSIAWRSRRDQAADAIAESMARVEARRAEHQARLAAEATEVS